ncbi:MAG: DUF2383 domain-containing protein [Bosea sp. (in: a-proteobacteria)]
MSTTLSSLHTAIIDAREGYGKAIEKAEDPAVRERLRAVDRLHEAAHADVHRILSAQGELADDDASLMGTVHKAVVTARSAILGLDEASLSAFASGEDNNLQAYDEAIAQLADPHDKAILQKHRDALALEVAQMKRQAS